MKYDVIIIGAGPGGIFAAYELMQLAPNMKVAVFEAGEQDATWFQGGVNFLDDSRQFGFIYVQQ